MHLERDQFVAETSQARSRAPRSARATARHCGRCACSSCSSALMVIYTFVAQLH